LNKNSCCSFGRPAHANDLGARDVERRIVNISINDYYFINDNEILFGDYRSEWVRWLTLTYKLKFKKF
jgi:hypothetical protein